MSVERLVEEQSKSSSPQDANIEVPITPLTDDVTKEDKTYITGAKLFSVIGSVTLIAFLLMLDQSIIGTVSLAAHHGLSA